MNEEPFVYEDAELVVDDDYFSKRLKCAKCRGVHFVLYRGEYMIGSECATCGEKAKVYEG